MLVDPLFFEKVIIKFLVEREDLRDKIIPFLTTEVFSLNENKIIISEIIKLQEDYETLSKQQLSFQLISKHGTELNDFYDSILQIDLSDLPENFILDNIETFYKEKLIYNLCVDSIEKLKESNTNELGDLPSQLQDALSFSFKSDVGVDFLSEEGEERLYQYLHSKDVVVPTGVRAIDNLIGGGFHEKSISIFLASTGRGKTLIMSSLAQNNLLNNKNVLYITFEIAKEVIQKRITSNMFNININELSMVTRDVFHEKFKKYRNAIKSKLIVEEFPTGTINCNYIKSFVKELYNKKKFKPDIIYLDYLGIMISNRTSKNDNTYTSLKRICQETRALSMFFNIPIVSAVQTNRDGMNTSNLELDDIADSIGIAVEGDLVIGIVQTPELKEQGRYLGKILKNRFGDDAGVFNIGVDKFKQRIYDLDIEKNIMLNNTPPVISKTIEESARIQTHHKKHDRKPVLFE